MQEVTYCSSDVVILSLAQDESCRCVEYILQGPDVNSAGAVHLVGVYTFRSSDRPVGQTVCPTGRSDDRIV